MHLRGRFMRTGVASLLCGSIAGVLFSVGWNVPMYLRCRSDFANLQSGKPNRSHSDFGHFHRNDTNQSEVASEVASGLKLQCGVFWFLHIPKVAGGTVKRYLTAANDRLWKTGARSWTFVDLQANRWCRIYRNPNMTSWAHSNGWKLALKELEKPRPRLLIHDHTCSKGFGEHTLPQLLELNRTLQKKGLDCRVALATMLRKPTERMISHIFYSRQRHQDVKSFVMTRSDFQVKFIMHAGQANWPGQVVIAPASKDLVQRAYDTLRNFEIVGDFADILGFVKRVSLALGLSSSDALAHANSQYGASFQSPHPYTLTDEELQLIDTHSPGDSWLYKQIMPNLTIAPNPL